MTRRVLRVIVVAATALAALLLPAAGAQARHCAGAHAKPGRASAATVRAATLCLLNHRRAQAGLGAIHANRRLAKAALRHSKDMVRRHYFDHSSPAGDTLLSRASAVHYVRPSRSWFLAENIAWGAGRLATPAAIVRSWMHSPPHRANILSSQVRDVGLGVAVGTPVGGHGATYTLDFGRIG